jgi:hypothetical protein
MLVVEEQLVPEHHGVLRQEVQEAEVTVGQQQHLEQLILAVVAVAAQVWLDLEVLVLSSFEPINLLVLVPVPVAVSSSINVTK